MYKRQEVEFELAESSVWDKPEYAQALGKERAILESIVHTIEQLESEVQESEELLILAGEEKDEELYRAANKELTLIQE